MTEDTEVLAIADALRRAFRTRRRDPLTGVGCTGRRVQVATPVEGLPVALVPAAMTGDPDYPAARGNPLLWRRLRCRHDFEYWAFCCVKIKYKDSWEDRPFVLNEPQQRLLGLLEADRTAGEPMRLILLKARQWGGSTFIQMYMAWIQICHRRNWNSVICAHVKDTSATIRGMYSKLLEYYPEELWSEATAPKLVPFERSSNIREIAGRGCTVTIASSEKPDSIRGGDYAMAHLSETAFWPATRRRSPRAVIAAICGSVALLPYTFVAIESTANGVGDFFHAEWLRNKAGQGDKRAVFVPWHEIDLYRLPPRTGEERRRLLETLTPREREIWLHGADSDGIAWYRRKVCEVETPEQLAGEFPSDDTEAFCSNTMAVFSPDKVELLRAGCREPGQRGEVSGGGCGFTPDIAGKFTLWKAPEPGHRYVASVDVGGRHEKSDFSVIAVLDASGDRPEVVGQWRGHTDHDLLAARSIDVARFYNNALLVIESNTFETDNVGGNCDSQLFILHRVADAYNNVYRREVYDSVTGARTSKIGFHTNRLTKAMLIAGLIETVRDCKYIERDSQACNELLTYEQRQNGSFAAKDGCHDDILMTRALALHVISTGAVPRAVPADFRLGDAWW